MKKLSKLTSILLAILLIISLAACDTSNRNTDYSGNPEDLVGCTTDSDDVTDIMSGGNSNQGNSDSFDESDTVGLGQLTGEPTTDSNSNSNSSDLDRSNSSGGSLTGNTNKDDSIDLGNILDGILQIRVIDCGQADSILLHLENYNILIDAGEEKAATAVRKVLDNLGISKIDLLVATHPHADHIGGMQKIVENYDIDSVMMYPTEHNTQTYQNLLIAIRDKGCNTIKAVPNNEYSYDNLKIKVLGPTKTDNDDLNNNSVVLLASFGNTDILLTGDASMEEEKDYIDNITDTIEILKVGHHGSDTATSDNLLDTIKPELAVISCGVNNKYGHPTEEVLNKLDKRGITTLRTDMSGDIIITTNGTDYTVETGNNESTKPGNNENTDKNDQETEGNGSGTAKDEQQGNQTVFVTKTGKKYHSTENCRSLLVARNVLSIDIQEAVSNGLDKCSNCWE